MARRTIGRLCTEAFQLSYQRGDSRIGLAVVVILRLAGHSMMLFFSEKQERDRSANFDRAISA